MSFPVSVPSNAVMLLILVCLASCNSQEQTSIYSSQRIEQIRQSMQAYESGDFTAWKKPYADTCRFYYNSARPISLDQAAHMHARGASIFSSYGYDTAQDYEESMSDSLVRVNFYGTWRGTLSMNGKTFEIPVHRSFIFQGGKIVREYGYWDNWPVNSAVINQETLNAASNPGQQ